MTTSSGRKEQDQCPAEEEEGSSWQIGPPVKHILFRSICCSYLTLNFLWCVTVSQSSTALYLTPHPHRLPGQDNEQGIVIWCSVLSKELSCPVILNLK